MMKLSVIKGSLLIGVILCSANANAAYVTSGVSNITYLSVYSRSTAPGDVLIKISNPAPECINGYYVLAESPGKSEVLSMALSAYHAKKKIRINGYDEPNWRGSSSNNTCEVEGINFTEY